jgi:hypothetical protein
MRKSIVACDRCGKILEGTPLIHQGNTDGWDTLMFGGELLLNAGGWSPTGLGVSKIDICPRCKSDLQCWLDEYSILPATWQPIETAPKDGTPIVACLGIDNDGNPLNSFDHGVHTQRIAWWGEEGWVSYVDQPHEPKCFFEPKFWMPIPKL